MYIHVCTCMYVYMGKSQCTCCTCTSVTVIHSLLHRLPTAPIAITTALWNVVLVAAMKDGMRAYDVCMTVHACVTSCVHSYMLVSLFPKKIKIVLFEGATFPELLQTILESANFHKSLMNPVTNLCSEDRP